MLGERPLQEQVIAVKLRLFFALLYTLCASFALAQDLRGIARVDVEKSSVVDRLNGSLDISLHLSQAIPYRIKADADRLSIDFQEVDWQGFNPAPLMVEDRVLDIRTGLADPTWSRIQFDLQTSFALAEAAMNVDDTTGQATLTVSLSPSDAPPRVEEAERPSEPRVQGKTRQLGDRPLVVMIDPGHGGIDPGARRKGYSEADLVLRFARELREHLTRTGRFTAFLTRSDDRFVALPARVIKARKKEADVFISLHADTVTQGNATGFTVYTLSETASDDASAELAAQNDKADLLAGVDLSDQDDQIATILMDIARRDTDARSKLLAELMVPALASAAKTKRRKPHLSAGFSVLKAPDIPSILIELGYLSSDRDLNNLLSKEWRTRVVQGITNGLDAWALEDAAQARLLLEN